MASRLVEQHPETAKRPQRKQNTAAPATPNTPKLDKLLKKEQQLKALIQKEKARLTKDGRKQRNAKLIAWGIAVEKLFEESHELLTPEAWAALCKKVLGERHLEQALVDELATFK